MRTFNGDHPVGIAWVALLAFLRIATNPRASKHPVTLHQARRQVDRWLRRKVVWTPSPTKRHAEILGDLVERHRLRGNLVTDAHLAALAIEHDLTVCSADADFERFPEVAWHNPLAA
jgi:toxin-antitoxin system PIN domain toxin